MNLLVNMNKEYTKNCPRCGKIQIYSCNQTLWRAKKCNSVCNNCNLIGNKNAKGMKHSDEWKRKMSEKNSGLGNPFYGKHHTDESKEKRKLTYEKYFLTHSNIPTNEDKGAKEFFNRFSRVFKPKRFVCNGKWVIADGYNKEKHIWFEFDTPYHCGKQLIKDLERQNNIIEYFDRIRKPLTSFYRFNVVNNEIVGVYHAEHKDKYNKQTGKLEFKEII